uniref:uncharacterized protein isoform X3 n=1 Tax=Myxine glutinosa TaxID=7769 RepID=UPI00358E527C
MACGLVLDPRQDFPAWLSTQGVNSHVAQAVEQELGIGDYEALLACAESAQVRSELFVLARERLPFATYAVLRRAIEGLASRHSDAVEVAQGFETLGLQPFLRGLLDSMVVLLTSVSQDLSLSAQRLRSLEPTLYGEATEATSSLSQGYAVSDPGVTGPEDMYRYDVAEEEEDDRLIDRKPPENFPEECNEICAVEQQMIPEASLNEEMIRDESQTIVPIEGSSSEHLLDVRVVKREPLAIEASTAFVIAEEACY